MSNDSKHREAFSPHTALLHLECMSETLDKIYAIANAASCLVETQEGGASTSEYFLFKEIMSLAGDATSYNELQGMLKTLQAA